MKSIKFKIALKLNRILNTKIMKNAKKIKQLQERKSNLVKKAKEYIKKFGKDEVVSCWALQCQQIDFQIKELQAR